MLNLGAADNRSFIMVVAMKYGRVSARVNGLAVVRRLRLRPERAERRGSSRALGALEVLCAMCEEGAAEASWVVRNYSRVCALSCHYGNSGV
jgi:hypothetical protein